MRNGPAPPRLASVMGCLRREYSAASAGRQPALLQFCSSQNAKCLLFLSAVRIKRAFADLQRSVLEQGQIPVWWGFAGRRATAQPSLSDREAAAQEEGEGYGKRGVVLISQINRADRIAEIIAASVIQRLRDQGEERRLKRGRIKDGGAPRQALERPSPP
ncbi:hypothetical protein AAFF_G00395990 [Aldrovandia affinis]|uniref:Uncharacterized protein n=1 Tax=Aldrovandia affinis TaxID=143900 RepID=A0AAD7SDB6_9TELE|nr:hypothetical protein AAFF_G00395990 [Aldrovandia affinis]